MNCFVFDHCHQSKRNFVRVNHFANDGWSKQDEHFSFDQRENWSNTREERSSLLLRIDRHPNDCKLNSLALPQFSNPVSMQWPMRMVRTRINWRNSLFFLRISILTDSNSSSSNMASSSSSSLIVTSSSLLLLDSVWENASSCLIESGLFDDADGGLLVVDGVSKWRMAWITILQWQRGKYT